MSDEQRKIGEPYCGNCGYNLSGSTESAKCPECGRPLVEVLLRGGGSQWGKRYRSSVTLFGLPILDIALGPRPSERMGKAKGIIAIGDSATGLLAIGGRAFGLVAFGGMAAGGFSCGGMSLGLFTAVGGMAMGLLASGGLAAGGLVTGGVAAGIVSAGGMAIGVYAAGGTPIGPNKLGPGQNDPAALAMFDQLSWFFGSGTPAASMFQPIIICSAIVAAVAGIVGLLALYGYIRGKEAPEPGLPPSSLS